jgi:ring-1,2-phenylacetyl-CoA epoxidase subunit PaaB
MISKLRTQIPEPDGELPPEPELKAYEVFVQRKRSEPHYHAGTLDAPDDEMALLFAREHYGQDEACVHIWVVARGSILSTNYDEDVITRLTDRSYKYARGYQDVRKKWQQFRRGEAIAEYEKSDLKEFYDSPT